jgi:LysM repeat protein/outer membrane protein assembly factor BamB
MSKKIITYALGIIFAIFITFSASAYAEANLPMNVDLKQTITPDKVSNGNYSKVVVQNQTLYIPDKQVTKVTAVSVENNTIKWEFSTGEGNEIREITAINGLIIYSTADKTYAIKDNGDQAVSQWSADTGGYSFASDGKNLYFYQGKTIFAFDLLSGAQKWTYTIPSRESVRSKIEVGDGKIYFVTDNQLDMVRKMYALDAETSQVMWTTTTVDYYSTKPVYKDGKIYLNFYKDLYAYDAQTGAVLWKFEVTPNFMFEVNKDTIFTKANTGYLYAYDKETKVLLWKADYADRIDGGRTVPFSAGPIFVTQNYVLIENNGKIKWFDVKTGTFVRELQLAGIRHQPIAASENVLVTAGSGNLYVYTPANDTVKPNMVLDSVSNRFSPYEGSQSTTLSFNLSEDSYVKVYVKHESGKVVRVLDFGLLKKGWNYKTWDGKDNNGGFASYGAYTFVFHLIDLAGNDLWLEDPAKRSTLADIFGTIVAETSVKKGPDDKFETMTVIPSGTKVTIVDETDQWYQVNFSLDSQEYNGYVKKSVVATRSNPNPGTETTQNETIIHTVQAGDTLWKIAQKYGTTVQAIVDANKLDPNQYLYIGQKLMIPGKTTTPDPTNSPVIHVVQAGDTLWKIAQKYGTTVQAIVDANNLNPNQYLYIGQKLMIPGKTTTPDPTNSPVIHVVQAGDTLWKIAQKYGTTIQVIVDANKIDPNKHLYVGQKLTIPTK